MDEGALVIVGASLAGAKAAEAARASGWAGPIRLLGAEPHLPYERPPLSKAVLIGRDSPDTARVHPGGFYVTNEIDLLLDATVTGLDLAARSVELEGGRRIPYARLVLATGSTPRRLRGPGADLPEVHYLRTVDDSVGLREVLLPGRRVAVIGASWIGTEVAACGRQRGCDVVMIDLTTVPLEQALGTEVGRYYASLHAAKGVELRFGVGVAGIEGSDHVAGVRLADGTAVDADAVIVGIGVTPNVELARHAGLPVATGVLVDATLATSNPDVFAAGDIAEAEHPTFGDRVRVEHWANALNQGLTAGRNAAGQAEDYDRVPYFFSDQYDTGMEYSGWPVAWDRVVFRGDPDGGEFVAFYLRGDQVVGAINVNVWDVNEHVQRIVRAGGSVDLDVLVDVDADPAQWATA
jgi:3-phenylpropionate/trans-cinnamate dioxygenase ferredoxin reductase subunit